MSPSFRSRWIAAVAVCLVVVLTETAAARHSEAAPACARFDARIVALIEDHDEAQDLTADELEDTSLALMKAQSACAAGRAAEAAAVFDGLFLAGPLAGH